MRRAEARINIPAIERNCARLCSELRGGAALCAVVKADGYGHGAAPSARAALAGGASWLAVADAREARELREAGLREPRVLVMGALSLGELQEALAADGDVVVWSERQLQDVVTAGGGRVHVKLDTGMGRLGTRDVLEASRVALAAREAEGVELVGVMTHFATADDLKDERLLRRAAADVHRVGAHAQGRAARAAGARRQQRRDAARARGPVRHGALWRRDLRHGSLRQGPRRPGPRAGARAELLRGRGEGVRAGRERWLRPAVRGRARHLRGGAADRLRRRLAARSLQQRRCPARRPPTPAGGHREHGQHHRRSRRRCPRPGPARPARGPDRLPGQRADHRRGGRPPPGDDQLRDHLRPDPARAPHLPSRRRRAGRARPRRTRPITWGQRAPHERGPGGCPHGACGRACLAGGRRGPRPPAGPPHRRPRRGRRGGPRGAPRAWSRARRGARHASRSRRSSAPGGSSRATAPGSSTSSRCAAAAWRRIWRCATSQSTRSPNRSQEARRSIRSAGSATCASVACGWPARAPSPRILCACCASCGWPSSWACSRRRRRSRSRRAQAHGLRAVSAERVFMELRRILAARAARSGLEMLGDLGAAAVVLPELEAMRGVEQSRFHHLDVYGHTLEVLDRTDRAHTAGRAPAARSRGRSARTAERSRAAGRAAGR